jgi:hypothetical protein
MSAMYDDEHTKNNQATLDDEFRKRKVKNNDVTFDELFEFIVSFQYGSLDFH